MIVASLSLVHQTRAAALSPIMDDRGGWRTLIREPFTGAWQRNQEWTVDTVLAHPAVYACVSLISQDVGKLRPKLVELNPEDGIWKETTSSAFSPVLRRPNRYQTHVQFKEWWTTSRLTSGNTYALKQRDDRGVVTALYILDPARVTVLVAPDGAVFYELKADNLSGLREDRIAVPASEIIHDRVNPIFHPLVGISPLFGSGTAAQLGLNIQNNSSAFFGNGSNPSGILSSPVTITPGKAEELSNVWNSQFGGSNTGRVAVLGDGMRFEAMRMTAVDSQMLEQHRMTSELICAAFHVPAWKIGLGQMPAYTNPEIASRTYYTDCLQTHVENFEACMDEGLGLTTTTGSGRVLGVELAVEEGLFRMDTATQIKTLTEGIAGGLYTPNEARRKVDLEPLTGGDTVYMQQQNYSLEALDARDRNDPFAKPEPPMLPEPAPQLALPPGEPEEEPEEDRGWDGFFARDALTLHQELRAFAVVSSQRDSWEQTRAALLEMGTAVASLATREPAPVVVHVAPAEVTVRSPDVHVAPPTVHVAPAEVNVTVERHSELEGLTGALTALAERPQAPVNVTVEAPKTASRSVQVLRDASGALIGAEITEGAS